MDIPTKTIRVYLDELLRDSKRQPTSMSLPAAVHHRLDVMTRAAGLVNPSRAEIIGMLIAETEVDAEALERRILNYRKKRVGDVVPDAQPEEAARSNDNVRELPVRGAGRPRKHAAD